MDDYDYLSMVREFLGEEAYTEYMNKFLRNYKEAGTDQIWYCERNEGNGWDGDWITWEVTTLNSARIAMGNALSAANTEHAYGEWEIAVACDDTHNGLEIRKCAVCGAQESRTLSACEENGHSYEVKKNDKNTHKEVCKLCGDTKLVAHTNETVSEKAPTCVETGLTAGEKCSVCDEVITSQETVNALGHSWDNGAVTTQPTCEKDGVKTYKCTRSGCTETKTEAVTKKGHTESAWIIDSDSTCSKQGSRHKECTVCHKVLKTETIAKKAHTEVTIPAVEATCIDTGLTAGSKCSVCGTVIKAQSTVAKKAHTDSDEDGVCDSCGTYITPAVDPKPCSCNCHKSGFMGFIWKIQNFFNKIFKINKTCACGVAHY